MLSGIRYGAQIETAAQRHGLDPRLLAAVAAQETGGPGSNSGANIVGDGGHGRGLFQIDDRWHTFAKTPEAMDPAENAEYAAGMLSGLLSEYGGNAHEALSAYNAGSPHATGTRTSWADGANLGYADSVLRHYAMLGGEPGATAPGGAAVPAGEAAANISAAEPAASGGGALSAAYLPPVTVPQPIPYPSQFRSFASMIQQGGPGAQVDAEMIGLLDPGDGSSSN